MKHAQLKELICLSVCDELSPDEERLLAAHLTGCEECRAELDEMRNVFSAMDDASFEVTEELLREARIELHAALVHTGQTRSVADRVTAAVDAMLASVGGMFAPRYQTAFGAAGVAVLGVFIGYLLFSPSGIVAPHDTGVRMHAAAGGSAANDSNEAAGTAQLSSGTEHPSFAAGSTRESDAAPSVLKGDVRAMNIRILHADARTGAIEFAYDAVSPIHVSGNVNDENVQRILVRTLRDDENAGLRLKAVAMLTPHDNTAVRIDPALKAAMIGALANDENSAVRLAVLDVLKLYLRDADVQRAFAQSLMRDRNPGVRVAAINVLAAAQLDGQVLDKNVLAVLKQKSRSDKNIFIRKQSRNVLQEESQL